MLNRKTTLKRKGKLKSKQKTMEQKLQQKEEVEKMWEFFQMLWQKLPEKKYCQGCGGRIYGENLSIYWDHLLEKSKYTELKYEEKNMFFCCFECHSKKTAGFPTESHKLAIDKAKRLLTNC